MTLQVAIPLFPRFTALDAIGPYEVLQRHPEIDVVFLGHERGEVRSENGFLGITRDATFEEVPRLPAPRLTATAARSQPIGPESAVFLPWSDLPDFGYRRNLDEESADRLRMSASATANVVLVQNAVSTPSAGAK